MQVGQRRTVQHFNGYKNYVRSDTKTKPIEEFEVTDASVHYLKTIEKNI
jgi:hypothetical protein